MSPSVPPVIAIPTVLSHHNTINIIHYISTDSNVLKHLTKYEERNGKLLTMC